MPELAKHIDRNYYTLDGVPLSDPLHRWVLAEGSEIRSVPARRNVEHVIPGVDGAITNLNPSFEPGALSFGIHILTGQTHDSAMEVLEMWNGILGQRGRLLPLDHTYNGVTRRAMVQIVASTETSQNFMRALTINVVATIPDVFWRSLEPTISDFRGSGLTRLDHLSGGSGPINDPIIKVFGPFTSVKLECPAIPNQEIVISTPASATQEIVFSSKTWTARLRNKSTSFGMGGTVKPRVISSNGMGTMFTLAPTFNYQSLGKEYFIKCTAVGGTSDTSGQVYANLSYL